MEICNISILVMWAADRSKRVMWAVHRFMAWDILVTSIMGVRVGGAYSRNKLARRLRNLNLRSHLSIFEIFRNIRVHIYDLLKFVGGLWLLKWAWQIFLDQSGVANFFLDQPIGIDETIHFS